MSTISRYVLVGADGVEDTFEHNSYHEAERIAGDTRAIIERTYSYSDEELVYTPDGSDTWPPAKKPEPVRLPPYTAASFLSALTALHHIYGSMSRGDVRGPVQTREGTMLSEPGDFPDHMESLGEVRVRSEWHLPGDEDSRPHAYRIGIIDRPDDGVSDFNVWVEGSLADNYVPTSAILYYWNGVDGGSHDVDEAGERALLWFTSYFNFIG